MVDRMERKGLLTKLASQPIVVEFKQAYVRKLKENGNTPQSEAMVAVGRALTTVFYRQDLVDVMPQCQGGYNVDNVLASWKKRGWVTKGYSFGEWQKMADFGVLKAPIN